MENFRVTKIGLDTSTIEYSPSSYREEKDTYDYLLTSISSNNDFIIYNYLKSQELSNIILSIDFLDNFKSMVQRYISEIDRNIIDILLFEVDKITSWGTFKDSVLDSINHLKSSLIVDSFGLRNPKNVEEIEKIINILGKDTIEYIALDLCPFNFNLDIIEWCNNNSIKIIGLNCFGGNINSSNLINSFTVPYLLGFTANYCDIVILSGRDLPLSYENYLYLKKLINSPTSSKYSLRKNVIGKLNKPFKKVVDTSFIIKEDEIVIPYENPYVIYPPTETVLNLGKTVKIFPKSEENPALLKDDVVNLIENQIKLLDFPKDSNINSRFSYYRYKILDTIRLKFPKTDGWELSFLKLGDRNFIISIKKLPEKINWWKKKKNSNKLIEKEFLFSMPDLKSVKFLDISNIDNKE